jgi:hypothetical protein
VLVTGDIVQILSATRYILSANLARNLPQSCKKIWREGISAHFSQLRKLDIFFAKICKKYQGEVSLMYAPQQLAKLMTFTGGSSY